MAFLVKIDEDLPAAFITVLERRRYSVKNVLGQGWGGLKDPVLWPKVRKEGAFFITADKGFGDIRIFPPGTHPGILLLRPGRESVLQFVALLKSVLEKYSLENLAGSVSVATPNRVRIRRKTS